MLKNWLRFGNTTDFLVTLAINEKQPEVNYFLTNSLDASVGYSGDYLMNVVGYILFGTVCGFLTGLAMWFGGTGELLQFLIGYSLGALIGCAGLVALALIRDATGMRSPRFREHGFIVEDSTRT